MNLFALPWLELSIVVPLVGAACVRPLRDAGRAFRCCLGFTGATLACALFAYAGHNMGETPVAPRWLREWISGPVLTLDEVNAPLIPIVALLHFLTTLATARTKMPRFSFTGLLTGLAVRLTAFACVAPWPLVGLLALEAVPPYFELRRRERTGRLYAFHAGLFILLLAGGWACTDGAAWTGLGPVLLLAAVLLRTGAVPLHLWVTELFENASFGSALMFTTPLLAVYAAVRLALPVASEWLLETLGIVALATAVYAAAMGVVESNVRRFFAYLYVSHGALVLLGLGLHTPFALTGALVMWASAALSLTGLGLTLRAIEARVGASTLTDFRGLYEQSPALAVCFLMTGLAAVGFPGTAGFVAVELLVDEAVGAHEIVGLLVVVAAAINGIGVVRAYLLLFTGRRHETGVSLLITPRERLAVLAIAALILGGGLFPQFYLGSRDHAAAAVLRNRLETLGQTSEAPQAPDH